MYKVSEVLGNMPPSNRRYGRRADSGLSSSDIPPPPPSMAQRARLMRHLDNPPDSVLSDLLQRSEYPSDPETYIHPATRLLELALIHGEEAAWDQLQIYLLDFSLKRLSIDRIAKNLDVDYQTAKQIMRDFKKRTVKQMEALEVNDLMHKSMGIIDYVQAQMANILDDPNASRAEKYLAVDRLLKSENERYKMLERNRYYDRKGYQPRQVEDYEPAKQSNMLKDMLAKMLSGKEVEETEAYNTYLDPCEEA